MRNNLNIQRVGWSVSAALAIPYALLMFASLLLVGKATSGSWQAAFLGITWNTAAGFEIGLVAIVMVGFTVALAFTTIYNAIDRGATSQINLSLIRSWSVRLLVALFVLLPLALFILWALAPILANSARAGMVAANTQIHAVNMGPIINSAFREAEPSFTADGRTMYFNCRNYDICVSHLIGTWEDANWTSPEIVGAPISTAYEEVEPLINAAGDKLYFTSTRPDQPFVTIPVLSPFINVPRVVNMLATGSGQSFFGGLGLSDVWVSYRINGAWLEPQNINDLADEPHINTAFEDHCLFFSEDGNEAFWTSTRPGGFGSDDIWTSRRVDGKWTEPENLGPNVNGLGSEHTSIPTPDGQSLYITTTRAEGFGGEDSYVTTRDANGTWGPLVNLGPLVNGPGDDRCPAWTPDLKIFLFDSIAPGGFGGRDIWWLYFANVTGDPLGAESAGMTP